MKIQLTITIVGRDICWLVLEKLRYTGIPDNEINHVNDGSLGNLKTVTYSVSIDEDNVVAKRREIIEALMSESAHLTPMYICGDWMHVVVFKKFSE